MLRWIREELWNASVNNILTIAFIERIGVTNSDRQLSFGSVNIAEHPPTGDELGYECHLHAEMGSDGM